MKRQHGMALIEAMIASAVLGIGLLGATQLTLKTLNTASLNRQRITAQQLAQEAMDCWQTLSNTCSLHSTLTVQGVTYTVQTARSARSAPLSDVSVQVQWGSAPNSWTFHSSAAALPGWVGVSSP